MPRTLSKTRSALVIAAILALTIAGSDAWAGKKSAPPKMLTIVAKIVSYTDFGAKDYMKDHADIHYATVKLKVVSPEDLEGRELTLMHEMPVSKTSILRKKGRRISFKIQRGYIDSSVLFTNVLEDLKLVR